MDLYQVAKLASAINGVSSTSLVKESCFLSGRWEFSRREIEVNAHVTCFNEYRALITNLKRLFSGFRLVKQITTFGGVKLQGNKDNVRVEIWVFIDKNKREVLSKVFKCDIQEKVVTREPAQYKTYVCRRERDG